MKKLYSAKQTFTTRQKVTSISIPLIILALAIFFPIKSLTIFVVISSIVYFLDFLFNIIISTRSILLHPEIDIPQWMTKEDLEWPKYSILCPLYKEAAVVPQFVKAMNDLDYPDDKKEILFCLEEDDDATINAIKAQNLPSNWIMVIVPDSLPKTKPKACNVALEQVTGMFTVIYDAEDIPEPEQLKKSVIAFALAKDPNLACIQAKLNYFNPNSNLLTRLFTLEYSYWFDLILPGLMSVGAPIPLGGTSNHLKTDILKEMGGWDQYNVTEDADLGMRLAVHGYRTDVLDSTTLEEANSRFLSWIRQRSRWIKGYMQTYLVHSRYQSLLLKKGFGKWLFFQYLMGLRVIFILINPIFWIMMIAYTFLEPAQSVIEQAYSGPIYFLALTVLTIGNFTYVYQYILAVSKRGLWSIIPYAIFVPFYWIMVSIAGYRALYDLITKPHHWHKTAHGVDDHLAEIEPSVAASQKILQTNSVTSNE